MWQRKVMALLIGCLPFLYNGKAIFPELIPILLLGGVCVFLLLLGTPKRIVVTYPDVLVVLLFVWMGIRIYTESPFCISNGIEFALLFLIYFLVRQWGTDVYIWIIFFIAGILQAFVGKYNFPNSGIYAGYLALSVLCGIGLLFKTRRWMIRLLISVGILVTGYPLIVSDSRSAWLALLVGCMVLFVVKSPGYFMNLWKQKWLLVFLFFLILGLGIALYFYKPVSANGRLFIWKVGLQVIALAPWIGNGVSAFVRKYMYAQADYFREHPDAEEIMLADNTWYAFNEILHLWCNWGIVVVVVVAVLAYILLRNCRKCSFLPVGVLAGLLAFSCFSYPASVFSLSVFYLFLAACLVNDAGCRNLYVLQLEKVQQWMIKGVSLLCLAGVGFIYSEFHKIDDLLEELRTRKIAPGIVIEKMDIFWGEPDYMARLGKLCYRQEYYEEAAFVLGKTILLRPTVEMFCDLGVAYAQTGNFEGAEDCFKMAMDMIPSRMLPRYRLFCLYRDKGQYVEAFDIAGQVLKQKVKVVNSLVLDIRREVKAFCEEYKKSRQVSLSG